MKFGTVPASMLDDIDFKIPAEPLWNKRVLKGTPVRKPRVFSGAAKWARREWIDLLYPAGTRENQYLQEYIKHFNSIELNATRYKIYDETAVRRWGEKARGQDFVFCPKVPQIISHYSSLSNAGERTTEFLDGMLGFGKHLGPIFLQLSEKFSPSRRAQLYDYVAGLPADLQFFVEVRHPEWFEDEAIRMELFQTLAKHKVGVVMTDTPGRRDCLHMHLTVPKAFIRFVANDLHPTDFTRIDDWTHRLKYWLDKGLKEFYFFLHTRSEKNIPELGMYLADQVKRVCGIEIKKPELIKH
ncbi:DUF72 domain-containing protein [Chitinophaga sp. sic0106]|uniref:DUF72 domain-containing protein n=1 Tax=Chitinophaga sp. sic0106 TaxID=2854785 RepID=UPI001C439C37|nr:DUF72 domain-containing protein [Chitinophaga sp. sic0106]MBV7529501.1 DUF72 domain-containing protein [Chitinophaga sp. sic0106]